MIITPELMTVTPFVDDKVPTYGGTLEEKLHSFSFLGIDDRRPTTPHLPGLG